MFQKKFKTKNINLSSEISEAIDCANMRSRKTALLALHKLKNIYNREKDNERFNITEREVSNDLSD